MIYLTIEGDRIVKASTDKIEGATPYTGDDIEIMLKNPWMFRVEKDEIIPAWLHPELPYKIVLPNETIKELSENCIELIERFHELDPPRYDIPNGVEIYFSNVLPEHQAIIEQFGGSIERF